MRNLLRARRIVYRERERGRRLAGSGNMPAHLVAAVVVGQRDEQPVLPLSAVGMLVPHSAHKPYALARPLHPRDDRHRVRLYVQRARIGVGESQVIFAVELRAAARNRPPFGNFHAAEVFHLEAPATRFEGVRKIPRGNESRGLFNGVRRLLRNASPAKSEACKKEQRDMSHADNSTRVSGQRQPLKFFAEKGRAADDLLTFGGFFSLTEQLKKRGRALSRAPPPRSGDGAGKRKSARGAARTGKL